MRFLGAKQEKDSGSLSPPPAVQEKAAVPASFFWGLACKKVLGKEAAASAFPPLPLPVMWPGKDDSGRGEAQLPESFMPGH